MVELLTRFNVPDAAAADRFCELLATIRQAAAAEPGFVSYAAYRTREEPTTLFVLERWRTRADADLHAEVVTQGEAGREALALLVAPPLTLTVTAVP